MLSRQIIFCVVTGVSVVVTGKIIVDDDGGDCEGAYADHEHDADDGGDGGLALE